MSNEQFRRSGRGLEQGWREDDRSSAGRSQRERGSFNDRWENAYGPRTPRESYERRSPAGTQFEPGYTALRHGAEFDNQARGSFRGRGPKGYRRSDERIREDVCDYLTEDDRVDASEIEVTVQGGEVTLAGSVSSREEKRRAEDLVENISGVRDVQNNLRIGAAQRESGARTQGSEPSIPHH